MNPRPANGIRVAHIGIAVDALAQILPFYRDILGMPVVPLDDSDGANITGLAADDTLIELLHSNESDTPVEKFLRKRGPGVHHICFGVDDLDGTLERCRLAGLRLIDTTPRLGAEGKRIAFLHPSATGGVLIELTEN